MSEDATVLIIGPSNTGKTNYIGRFWLALDQGRGIISKARLPQQLEYLQACSNALLEGKFAERTPQDTFTRIEIPFEIQELSTIGELVLPDVSGEDCEKIFEDRLWNQDWESAISNCVGCLVFLRERELKAPLSWLDVQELIIAKQQGKAFLALDGDDNIKREIPTQVLLVEWMQFLRSALNDVQGHITVPNIGVVIAAWDELGEEDSAKGPKRFLEDRLPLFYQFIETNQHKSFNFEVFGVSSTGGDLTNDRKFRDEYLLSDPHDKGFVVYYKNELPQQSADITLPVAWVLGKALDSI